MLPALGQLPWHQPFPMLLDACDALSQQAGAGVSVFDIEGVQCTSFLAVSGFVSSNVISGKQRS